jgi:4a-hydroxytetrahydrobiopterin dehydratase
MTTTDGISPSDFQQAPGLEDWRVLGDGGSIFFRTGSNAESARLVQAVGELDGVDDRHPAIDIRQGGVTVRLITFAEDYAGMTERDRQLAQGITEAARDLGLSADPSKVQYLLVIPGAADIAEVMPFWQALLGYDRRIDSPEEDLVDPQDRGSGFWFEGMDEPRPGGGGRSTWRSGCPTSRRRVGSRRRWPLAGGWSGTSSRPHGGRSRTRPAMRRTSPRPPAARPRASSHRRATAELVNRSIA